jgi:hypothetical protein
VIFRLRVIGLCGENNQTFFSETHWCTDDGVRENPVLSTAKCGVLVAMIVSTSVCRAPPVLSEFIKRMCWKQNKWNLNQRFPLKSMSACLQIGVSNPKHTTSNPTPHSYPSPSPKLIPVHRKQIVRVHKPPKNQQSLFGEQICMSALRSTSAHIWERQFFGPPFFQFWTSDLDSIFYSNSIFYENPTFCWAQYMGFSLTPSLVRQYVFEVNVWLLLPQPQ